MAAVSLNSVVAFNSTLQSNNHSARRRYTGTGTSSSINFSRPADQSRTTEARRLGLRIAVANSDKVSVDFKENVGDSTTEDSSASTGQIDSVVDNGSALSQDPKQQEDSVTSQPEVKRAPLTAREKLRAARVLSRYGESKPKTNRAKLGTSVLAALKESDKGKRSGLPEAPTNMLDDSKRGMPKDSLTWDLPGGRDLLVIAFSFVFISTVMFTTTYVVWKLGAIHFNEN